MKKFTKKVLGGISAGLLSLTLLSSINSQASVGNEIPDLSEWQGQMTDNKVKSLKSEAPFVIQRIQYGSNYIDKYQQNNINLYKANNLKFGAYAYACFISVADARQEARDFYNRTDKNTLFYALDYEELTLPASQLNAGIKAWYDEMRSLTKKPLVFYSYVPFIKYYNINYSMFDANWIARYAPTRPSIQTDLWQHQSDHYYPNVGSTDSNVIIGNRHSLSFWIGKGNAKEFKDTFVNGGYKVGQKVVLNNTATTYQNPINTSIPTYLKGKEYTIGQVKSVNTSTSNQALYIPEIKGWVLAQDVHTDGKYYKTMPNSKTLKTINTVHLFKDPEESKYVSGTTYGPNTVFTVKSIQKSSNNTWVFKTDSGFYLTANTSYVKVTSKNVTPTVKPVSNTKKYYTVQSGDSFWTISQHLGISMNTLASLNGKSLSSTIYPGEKLQYTGTAASSSNRYYTVQSGDSFWTISQHLGISMNTLASLNGKSLSSTIHPGDVLKY